MMYMVFTGFYDKIVFLGIYDNMEDAIRRRDEFNKTSNYWDGKAEIETVPVNKDVYIEL